MNLLKIGLLALGVVLILTVGYFLDRPNGKKSKQPLLVYLLIVVAINIILSRFFY